MRNILKLSLAVVAISALAACGGGDGSADATDVYVGTWKSACVGGTTASGSYVYSKRIRTLAKVSATELAGSTVFDNPFSDAGCTVVAGSWSSNVPSNTKYVLGAKISFLGAMTDSYVVTFPDATQAAGYMVVDGVKLFMADNSGGSAPTNWGSFSPYTKQ